VTFTAEVRNASGNVLNGRTVSWSTDVAGVATVSSAGMVTAITPGSAVVTATSEGQSGTAAVTVQTPAPIFHSTLDDLQALTTPLVGAGAGAEVNTSPPNDFVAAMAGNGVNTDAVGERVLIPQTDGTQQNVELDKGTIEFWYRPGYDHDDGVKYTIAGTGNWFTPGSWHFGQHNASNNGELFVIYFNAQAQITQNNVVFTDYSWSAGQWILIRITWDWTVAPGVQNLHLYFDGQEVPFTQTANGPVSTGVRSTGAESNTSYVYLGSRDLTGNIGSLGVYDEVRIWDVVYPPN